MNFKLMNIDSEYVIEVLSESQDQVTPAVANARLEIRVAVVVPLYKQSQFLVECITSALNQTLGNVGIVVINDGCPTNESHELCVAYSNAYPDNIIYVRQKNRGLSGARNSGIRRALNAWPSAKAVFLLDSDNIIKPETLEIMYKHLSSNSKLGWVYPYMQNFGEKKILWHWAEQANLYRMFVENQSDAGSLIRREVFEQGTFFDETMRSGYEDWEFFIRVLKNNWKAESCGDAGFYYRTKKQSMLLDSKKEHDHLINQIHNRHQSILEPRALTHLENSHAPRYTWISLNNKIKTFTDPDLASELNESLTATDHKSPIILLGSDEIWELLERRGMLRSILCWAQEGIYTQAISLEIISEETISLKKAKSNTPHLIAVSAHEDSKFASTDHRKKVTQKIQNAECYTLSLQAHHIQPVPLLKTDQVNSMIEKACQFQLFEAPHEKPPYSTGPITNLHFMWEQHCENLHTTYPMCDSGHLQICFVVPWLGLGGVDLCVIKLAGAMRKFAPKVKIHLVMTLGDASLNQDDLAMFDEIISLRHMERERCQKLCDILFNSMDLVVNAHSYDSYRSLEYRLNRDKSNRHGTHISYLHVIDQTKKQELVGYPYEAVEVENGLDGFVVISQNLKNFLINKGVGPERIDIARNAAVVFPNSIADSYSIADKKAQRLAAGERPIKLLFAGRADYQKGLSRLKSLIEELLKEEVQIEFTFVGSSVIAEEAMTWPEGSVHILPATHNKDDLAHHYAEADIFILLSRWEGVPLSILDAMAHGCLVISTDVGAISELITDSRNGYLITNTQDDEIVQHASEIIKEIDADPTGANSIRHNAVETSWKYCWEDNAKVFLKFLSSETREKFVTGDL